MTTDNPYRSPSLAPGLRSDACRRWGTYLVSLCVISGVGLAGASGFVYKELVYSGSWLEYTAWPTSVLAVFISTVPVRALTRPISRPYVIRLISPSLAAVGCSACYWLGRIAGVGRSHVYFPEIRWDYLEANVQSFGYLILSIGIAVAFPRRFTPPP
jgi:hypothetical protein